MVKVYTIAFMRLNVRNKSNLNQFLSLGLYSEGNNDH